MNRLLIVFFALLIANGVMAQKKKVMAQERIIRVDFKSEKGPLNTMFKECVGAGRANEGLRADWQQ